MSSTAKKRQSWTQSCWINDNKVEKLQKATKSIIKLLKLHKLKTLLVEAVQCNFNKMFNRHWKEIFEYYSAGQPNSTNFLKINFKLIFI
jgi:hypothetical protein